MPTLQNTIVPIKARGQKIYTEAELDQIEFPPIEYLIPGLITEGLTILAGKPKIGKSFMAYAIAKAIADENTTECLGRKINTHGPTLYCCLEDGAARLQRRSRQLRNNTGGRTTANLHIATDWPNIDAGALEELDKWKSAEPNGKLIIFDTLARIRPPQATRQTHYDSDYAAIAPLQKWSLKNQTAILLIHHLRKQEADDPQDTMSGTTGLTGCADTNLIITRSAQGTTIHVRSRDIEETDHAAAFDPISCTWKILGNAKDTQQSEARAKIMQQLKWTPRPVTPKELAMMTSLDIKTIEQHLYRMVKDGTATKIGRGQYVLTELLGIGNIGNVGTD